MSSRARSAQRGRALLQQALGDERGRPEPDFFAPGGAGTVEGARARSMGQRRRVEPEPDFFAPGGAGTIDGANNRAVENGFPEMTNEAKLMHIDFFERGARTMEESQQMRDEALARLNAGESFEAVVGPSIWSARPGQRSEDSFYG